MALGKPAIIRFAGVRPLLFRRSIIPRRRLSSHGIRPPPEITYSTPSCRIRRAAVAASPSDPPAAAPASRQIFGVLVPSKHEAAPGTAEALATGAAAGAAMPRAARLAVFSSVLRDGLLVTDNPPSLISGRTRSRAGLLYYSTRAHGSGLMAQGSGEP